MRLVIVELIVLVVVSLLEDLHLFKVLLAVLVILIHLLRLLLCKKLVIFPDLHLLVLFDSLLEVKSVGVVPCNVDLLLFLVMLLLGSLFLLI